jgi:hypothetical protein
MSLKQLLLPAAAVATALVAAAAATAGANGGSCSAKGMSAALPAQSLPAKVAAVRTRIARAAVACDYAALERIAKENPQGFKFTYGTETSAAAYWRKLEASHRDKPMRRLVGILRTPFVRNEIKAYAWPSAYKEKPTAADWSRLVASGAYTRAEVNRLQKSEMYLGYRTAISPQGKWLFFVAGD